MTTAEAREILYHRLTEVLGQGPADTLMSHIPNDQPATKADLEQSQTLLRAEVSDFRTELQAEVSDFRTELRAEMSDLRTELRADMSDLRTELRADIGKLDDRIHELFVAIHSQTRVHVAASMGSAVTVAGLVFIAAQLV